MKIERNKAVALLVALGFSKAGEWDDAKITTRLKLVPEKVPADKVPEGFVELYNTLNEAAANEAEVELTGDKATGHAAPTEEEEGTQHEEEGEETKKPKMKAKANKVDKAVDKAAATAKGKAPKPAKPAKAAKPAKVKKEKAPKAEVERDEIGCRVGTISFKVNAAVTDDWQNQAEIATTAGVPERRTRTRLRNMIKQGRVERRRLVQYRYLPKQKKGKATTKE